VDRLRGVYVLGCTCRYTPRAEPRRGKIHRKPNELLRSILRSLSLLKTGMDVDLESGDSENAGSLRETAGPGQSRTTATDKPQGQTMIRNSGRGSNAV